MPKQTASSLSLSDQGARTKTITSAVKNVGAIHGASCSRCTLITIFFLYYIQSWWVSQTGIYTREWECQ